MRRALVIDPLPGDASDITAFGALALDQPRDLLFPAVRHRVKFGMRNGPTASRIGARRRLNASPSVVAVILPSRPSAFALAERSLVAMLDADARMDEFMREDAGDPHAVGDHRRD